MAQCPSRFKLAIALSDTDQLGRDEMIRSCQMTTPKRGTHQHDIWVSHPERDDRKIGFHANMVYKRVLHCCLFATHRRFHMQRLTVGEAVFLTLLLSRWMHWNAALLGRRGNKLLKKKRKTGTGPDITSSTTSAGELWQWLCCIYCIGHLVCCTAASYFIRLVNECRHGG